MLRLTAADWRANSLVDALAKIAAVHLHAPPSTINLNISAEAAAAHAACLLGVVTHAANSYIPLHRARRRRQVRC